MYGFLVEIELADELTSSLENIMRDFIGMVEGRGLQADGGTGRRLWTYMLRSEASQATDADREAVERWAASRPEVKSIHVGELQDLQGDI